MSKIDEKYESLGGETGYLGTPMGAEASCADGQGRFRDYKHGSIYSHPLSGTHEIHGLIHAKWNALGREKSVLGYPKSDERDIGGGVAGRYNIFQGGAITWKQGAPEAFETHGAIRSKFGQTGWESGILGFPTTDETKTPDGMGRFNHFERGSIYWKPTISAHEVHGLIHTCWANNDWEKNPDLGYPISDELPTHSGAANRFCDFENGVVHWTSGSPHAASLPPFVLGNASRTKTQMMEAISASIKEALSSDDRLYIKSGPKLAAIMDYSWDGAQVRNRRYKVRVDLGVDISHAPDPTVNLDVWIGVGFDRSVNAIWSYLDAWHTHTHVPFPTSKVLKAKEINAKFEEILDPMIGKPQNPENLPDGIALLSVKVMPNGDLNTYAQFISED